MSTLLVGFITVIVVVVFCDDILETTVAIFIMLLLMGACATKTGPEVKNAEEHAELDAVIARAIDGQLIYEDGTRADEVKAEEPWEYKPNKRMERRY